MQCDINVFNDVAQILLEGIETGITEAGLPQISRAYIATGPIPAEDCCPDLVVWVSNIRFYDVASPDSLQENRLLEHFGMAFDLNVRLGLCYIESDESGQPSSADVLHNWSQEINRYSHTAYLRGVQALHTNTELDCIASISPRAAEPYNLGGCAGISYSVSVGIL